MKRTVFIVVVICMAFVLAACSAYKPPSSTKDAHPGPYLALVQAAIDGYYVDTQVLPIKNSELTTPLYEKYQVDFARLKNHGYLQSIPDNAYENGGNYYYVLVDVETEPTVKLLHLGTAIKLREVQRQVNDYASKNQGEFPIDKQIYPEWHTLNYDKLNTDDIMIKSMFSGQYLGLLIHSSGTVVIDYALDINQVMMDQNITEIAEDTDLRSLLVAHSYYVPIESNAYNWINNEPVLSAHLE